MTPLVELVGALVAQLPSYGLHIAHLSDHSIAVQHTSVQVHLKRDRYGKYSYARILRKHGRPRDLTIWPGTNPRLLSFKALTVAVLVALTQDAREEPA